MAFTANHSLRSSPEGNSTARDMFPLPRVICAICFRCMYLEFFSKGFKFFMGFIRNFQIINDYLKLIKYKDIELYCYLNIRLKSENLRDSN